MYFVSGFVYSAANSSHLGIVYEESSTMTQFAL